MESVLGERGDSNTATIDVQTNENGAGWVTRGSYGGGDLGTNDDPAPWNQENLDLADLISSSSTQIRILVTFPSTGTVWHNDVGIDSVTITATDPEGGTQTATSEITVNVDGVYHVAYGIDSEISSTGINERFAVKTKLQIDSGSGFTDAKACYGDSYARGFGNPGEHATITATSSCLLELTIGDKIRAVSTRASLTIGADHTTTADEIYLTIQSLTISNPPLEETLSFGDTILAFVIKNLPESLTLDDSVVSIKSATVSLTEDLTLVDTPVTVRINGGLIFVSIVESLSLDDGTITNLVLPIRLPESLIILDVLSFTHDKTLSLSESLSLDDGAVVAESFIVSSPDFKVQHDTVTLASGTFVDISSGTDFDACTGDCFIMQVSTRQTGMGDMSNGATQDVEDVTTYISDDSGLSGGDITFTRDGTANDNRIAWQILEYIGPANGPNEMKVLGTDVCSFVSATDTSCTGTAISGGASDDNDVAVIITGISGDANTSTDYDAVRLTSEWKGASNVPVFNRTATNSVGIDVSYAVVEFTGVAWSLQRVEHTGIDSPDPSTTITDIGDLSRAFILQAQQRNAEGAQNVCETGERVWLSDTDKLSFKHEFGSGTCAFNNDMEEVIWILSNTNNEIGKKMIVEHQQPTDQLTTGGGEEDEWFQNISTLTYGTDETGVYGFTANSDGTGTTHPHGTAVAELTDSTTVTFWQSQDDEELGYSFSVVQWPRSRVLSVAFVEDLSLSDDASVNIRISLAPESLVLDDGIVETHKTATVSLTEDLELVDVINRNIPASLTEDLEFIDVINRNIDVSLTEDLEFLDVINRNFPVSLTEDLEFIDVINRNIDVSLTEDLEFVDAVNRNFPVSLTEDLDFVDAINRDTAVSLLESILIDDGTVELILVGTVSLTESLSLVDVINKGVPASFTETLTLVDSATQLVNIAPNQVLIENMQQSVAVAAANTELVITNSSALLSSISIMSGATDVTMNYTAILTGTDVTIDNDWTLDVDLDGSIVGFDVEVQVANDTTISGPAGWNGLLVLPTFSAIGPSDTETETYDDTTAFTIGTSGDMTFDEPIRIQFTSDGGNEGFVAWFQTTGGPLTFITTTCTADDLTTVDAQLGVDEDCVIDDGTHLIVWTKHFTSFGASKRSSTSSGGDSGSSSSSGGSAGTSGAGGGGFAGILGTPLAINEVSYDKCNENMARILVSSDAEEPPKVVLHTTISGTVYATLAEEQPFADLNQFTSVDKYVYEALIASDETFMMVVVSEIKDEIINRVQSPVYLTSCTDSVTIVELPEEEEVSFDVPRIFDMKFQIDNSTSQKAEINSVSYLDEQDMTVTAIVDSKSALARAELRTVTLGQSDDEYVAIKMDIESMKVSNSTSFVSATIPSNFMAEPGVKYWIHIIDENLITVDSKQYEFGIKPTTLSNVSVEMDMPTVRPTGASIKPEVYIFTDGTAAYGTVSLIVNGETVSEKAQFFELGQTKVTFDWDIPKSDSYTSNELQSKVDLYDSSIITESATIHSHPRTTSVSSSQLPSLELIEVDGQVIADPALIYSSNSDENLQFRVIDPQGQCVIGITNDCTINESTKSNRGGLTSIIYGDQILRVKYSGADNALERFSITSIDPITGKWTVSVENEDGFIQQAHATEDISVKVKYRYHSETITAFSN